MAEGVVFRTNAHVGHDVPVDDLRKQFDAILLAGGAEHPRDLNVPGRELRGIHFAMDFLPLQNRLCAGDRINGKSAMLATGKRVVIIGGGDTGADCLGTCHRQKAASVHQFEIMPLPPAERAPQTPWPLWPLQLRIESSHEEGGVRDWAIATTKFTADAGGNVEQLHAIRVGPPPKFEPIPDTDFTIDVDVVLLAMGFTGPEKSGMLDQLGLKLDAPRQRGGGRELHVLDGWRFRGRRYAPRPVAGGLGHRRRPQSRPRHRPLPDGHNAAAVRGKRGRGKAETRPS